MSPSVRCNPPTLLPVRRFLRVPFLRLAFFIPVMRVFVVLFFLRRGHDVHAWRWTELINAPADIGVESTGSDVITPSIVLASDARKQVRWAAANWIMGVSDRENAPTG